MLRITILAVIVGVFALSASAAEKPATPAKSDSVKTTVAKLKPQTTCPVTGDPIDKNIFVDYQGKRIYMCCTMCVDSVKKDPERYIKKLESMGQGVETIGEASGKAANGARPDTGAKVMKMKGMQTPDNSAGKSVVAGYYTCPMHPAVHQAQPGNCPKCGMTLVRKNVETKSQK